MSDADRHLVAEVVKAYLEYLRFERVEAHRRLTPKERVEQILATLILILRGPFAAFVILNEISRLKA